VRTSTEANYILAGRTFGPMLVAFSMFATWFADTVAVPYLPRDHGHKLCEQRGLGAWPEG
jgi:hypothetical protein